MTTLTVSGKTIDEAVQKGLTELKASKDQVDVRVIDQPSKGFLGLIGVRAAKVELTLKQEAVPASPSNKVKTQVSATTASIPSVERSDVQVESLESDEVHKQESNEGKTVANGLEEAKAFVMDVARTMGLSVDVTVDKKRDHFMFDIAGEDLGLIIGRRGQTLDSLQYLTNLVANRYSDQHLRIILDAEQFRDRRKQTLEALAERLANKVIRTHKEVVLEPMSPQERKIIHAKLQDHDKVKTYSKGEDPNRRIVIALK